jgi:hypothetical protein
MNNWLITNRNIEKGDLKFENQIKLNHGYCLYYSDLNINYHLENENNGIFIFGYYINRLEKSEDLKHPAGLFKLLLNENINPADYIKGIFTIVLINNGEFKIFNDPLGISKFFYSRNNDVFSGRINYCKKLLDKDLSQENLLEYYVFNYSLNGNTFFKNIFNSVPASIVKISDNGKVSISNYFDILHYLSHKDHKVSNKKILNQSAGVWTEIINQWVNTDKSKPVSLTLTAGLDSRIILASIIKSGNKNLQTFTFGHPDSYDVVYAKKFASKYNIQHQHMYPAPTFFANYAQYASEVHSLGDTLTSVYRAHRFDAYKQIMTHSSAIFMGIAGSDLVRGFSYDGLIVSDIAFNSWNKNSPETYFNKGVINKLKNIGFDSVKTITQNIDNYRFIEHPLGYLFKVIIPLHFSQDILINSNNGWKTILPFLDLDYLDFLKNSDYLGVSDFSNYKVMNYRRRSKGLYYSANLLNMLNGEFAEFTLGKGYSAKNIVDSEVLAAYKGIKHKIINRNKAKQANFSYGKWYHEYLSSYFNQNKIHETGLNEKYLRKKLKETEPFGGELHFLDLTKAINIHLSLNDD